MISIAIHENNFDVIIIGAGIYGQLTALKLGEAGLKIALCDAHMPGHAQGSSSGVTRAAHTLYDEPVYAGLAKQSLAGFKAFYDQAIYSHDAVLFAENHDPRTHAQNVIAAGFDMHTPLSAQNIQQNYAGFKADYGCLDQSGGVFQLEAIRLTLKERLSSLETIKAFFNCAIQNIELKSSDCCVHTTHGTIHAAKIIIAAGYGSQDVVNKINLPQPLNLDITMVSPGTVHHFKPRNAEQKTQALSMPAFAYIERGVFGIPMVEGIMDSVKIAGFFDPRAEEKRGEEALGFLKTHIPFLLDFEEIEPPVKDGCQYDYTKDCHFILGNLNAHPNLYLACGWNGGGYKFSYAVSDLLCQSILTGQSVIPVLFSPNRLVVDA